MTTQYLTHSCLQMNRYFLQAQKMIYGEHCILCTALENKTKYIKIEMR
jgi:hypothetical protein